LIQIRLGQIELDGAVKKGAWLLGLRHVPRSVPLLQPAALSLLQLTQPMLVSLKSAASIPQKDRSYRLEAGLRTFQLLLEHHTRDERVLAVSVPTVPAADRPKQFAFDTVVAKLIQRPAGADLAILAAALLEDRELREAVGTYMDVGSDSAIADILGMSRSTMHRQAAPYRKEAVDHQAASEKKVSLEIDTNAGEASNEA
jgi:hypothetical protein